MTPEVVSHLQQISSGHSIFINEEEAIKLRFISILLGNEELEDKLNEHFPPKYSESNVNSYLKNIECCIHFSSMKPEFDHKSLISFVSSHFDQLKREDFLKVPRRIQYEIISQENLRIESEDSLFDIVTEIIELGQEKEEISDVMFLEHIEFTELSEDRLFRFVEIFEWNEMSGLLWNKLSKCLLNQTERKRKTTTTTIIVGGDDEYNQLGEKPNNKNEDGTPVISPPLNLSLDSSSLLSYSVYCDHSVLVTRGGSLLGIGDNSDGRISSSLTKTEISQFTEFSIKDDSGRQLAPISAVCSQCGTLYMFSKISGDGRQLVYCDKDIKGGDPVFLDIGDEEPVSLFGGCLYAAAISDKGEVIFINRYAVKNSPNSRIAAVSLPEGEKASSVACLEDSVFVLSSNGRVFSSKIESGSNVLRFSLVSELSGCKIVWVSGTRGHCLAVSKEGRVFGLGSNEDGRLGLGEETESVSSFTEISSLLGYEIRAAYAGFSHSLFETREGKILSCGSNFYGQLLLSSGPSKEKVYSPRETTITGGATFCIAGECLSSVFVGGYPPRNTPNMRMQHHQ